MATFSQLHAKSCSHVNQQGKSNNRMPSFTPMRKITRDILFLRLRVVTDPVLNWLFLPVVILSQAAGATP
jgi:hypothetical protein